MRRKSRGITRTTTSKAIAARARNRKTKLSGAKRAAVKRAPKHATKRPLAGGGRPAGSGGGLERVASGAGAAAKRSAGAKGSSRTGAAAASLGRPSGAVPTTGSASEHPSQGEMAPSFRLRTGDGREIALSDFAGQKSVVLYFYPKDMTSGCTAEACAFRDAYGRIRSLGAEILGVSMDGTASHAKFAQKYELPFPLLADEGGAVSKAYGVYKEKSLYGRKFWGIERSTFVIGKDGVVRRAWRKVKVSGHDGEVLEALAVPS